MQQVLVIKTKQLSVSSMYARFMQESFTTILPGPTCLMALLTWVQIVKIQ